MRAVRPDATIVRPPVIYGPGDRETLPLFQVAARGWLPLFNPHGRLAAIHAADAAAQIVFAVVSRPTGRTVTLCDARPEGYAWREVLEAAGVAVGRKVRIVPVPDAAIRAAGLAGDLAARLGAEPFLTIGKAREALHRDWSVGADERDLEAPLPRFDLASGFMDTVAWARGRGLPPSG